MKVRFIDINLNHEYIELDLQFRDKKLSELDDLAKLFHCDVELVITEKRKIGTG